MEECVLLLVQEDDIAILSLNRPLQGNAMDLGLVTALRDALLEIGREAQARCLVLRANGKLFCGGGDLQAFACGIEQGASASAKMIGDLVLAINEMLIAMTALPMPVIAAVHGVAAGAGMSLVLAADLAYGTPAARLVPAYAGVGLCGDAGATWFLPRLVGRKRAAEILLTNRPVLADEAVALGLLNGIPAQDQPALDATVLKQARALAAGPAEALAAIRRLLIESDKQVFAEHLAAEEREMRNLGGGVEFSEGVMALLGKRPALFNMRR